MKRGDVHRTRKLAQQWVPVQNQKKQGYVNAEQERIDPRDIIEGDAFSWDVSASRE